MNEVMWKLVHGVENLYPYKLEQLHPRVLEKIVKMWSTPMMEEFFQDLLVNAREDRQGFSPEVASEIYYLSKVFEGTRNLPKLRDDNLMAHLNARPVANDTFSKTGNHFKYSQQDFISMRAPSDDSPWAKIGSDKRLEIERKGYPCTAPGFLMAVGARDIGAVSLFLNCRINIDTCDERRWTPLITAAFLGAEDLAKFLIMNGANVNIKDAGGYVPMHWAAFKGHAQIIKLLVMNEADVNARSSLGWSPLMVAAMNGHLSACTALIASGANIDLSTQDGWTALQKASFNGHQPVVKLFLSLMKADLSGFKLKRDSKTTFNANVVASIARGPDLSLSF